MRIAILVTLSLISTVPAAYGQRLVADFCFCNPDNILENLAPNPDFPDAVAANEGTQSNAGPDVPLDETGLYNDSQQANTGMGTGVDIPASILAGAESITLEFDVRNQKASSIILFTTGGAEEAENNPENLPFRIGNKTSGEDGNFGLIVDYYTTADPDNLISSDFIGVGLTVGERATITFIYDQVTGTAELFKNGELVWETPEEQRTPGAAFFLNDTKTTDDGLPIATVGQNMNNDSAERPSLYSFRATDAACPIVEPPTVAAVDPLCGGGEVLLVATSDKEDGDYRWYDAPNGAAIEGAVNSTYLADVTQTTTYYVAVVEGPCSSERVPVEVRVISVPPPPEVADQTRCAPGTFTLEVNGTEGYTYRWYAADGVTLLSADEPETDNGTLSDQRSYTTEVLSETTEFYVSAVNEGCEGEPAKVTARVLTPPPPPTLDDVLLCEPGAAALDVGSSTDELMYRWYARPTGGEVLSDTEASTWDALVLSDTTFYVSSWDSQCESERVPVAVTIYQEGSLDAGPDGVMIPDGEVELRATEGYANYEWYPTTGLSDPTVANPVAQPTETTTYWVTAATTSGCEDADQVTVEVTGYPIPNAFTPNGDGLNDQWELSFLERYPNCQVTVYNRWGETVYYSQGYADPWDGRLAGQEAALGTYTYTIDLGNNKPLIRGGVVMMR